MTSFIGLYTQDTDSHFEGIAAALKLRGLPFVRFDRSDFPQKLQLTTSISTDSQGPTWHGSFFYEHKRYWLEDMRSILYRRPSTSYGLMEGLSSEETDFAQAEAKRGWDGVLRSLSCLWVNHPDALQAAAWKPRQLQIAKELGFHIPKTLITNDPAEALRFFQECDGRLVYKPLSAPPSLKDHSGADRWSSIYTTKLTYAHLQALAPKIAHTAHLFQQEVAKELELRVNIFGTRVFSTALYSQHSERTRVDWRCGYEDLTYGDYTLPEHLHTSCLQMMSRLQLHFGALDFAVTPDGEHVFFENNANGQWMWVEAMTGQPLTEAMVDLLANE